MLLLRYVFLWAILPFLLAFILFVFPACSSSSSSQPTDSEPDTIGITPVALTQVACPTPEEAEYIESVRKELRSIGTLLTLFGANLGKGANAPLLFFDETWRLGREVDIEVMQALLKGLKELNAPPFAGSLERQVHDLADDLHIALADFGRGLEQVDSDLILAASNRMGYTEPDVLALGRAMDSFCTWRHSSSTRPTSTRTIPLNQRTEYVPSYNTWQPAQDITPVATVAPPQVPTPFPVFEPRPTLTPKPTRTPMPAPTPTPTPSPTPDGPLMSLEECSQVIEAYMAENIEDIILSATDNPMSFRYWTEATEGNYYGYKLHFNRYTGFGIKPTHHEVKGTVFIHWWDNTVRGLYVAFHPHAVTCLPIHNAEYFGMKVGAYGAFEYDSTVGPILIQWNPYVSEPHNVEYALRFVDVDAPAGVVEIER